MASTKRLIHPERVEVFRVKYKEVGRRRLWPAITNKWAMPDIHEQPKYEDYVEIKYFGIYIGEAQAKAEANHLIKDIQGKPDQITYRKVEWAVVEPGIIDWNPTNWSPTK